MYGTASGGALLARLHLKTANPASKQKQTKAHDPRPHCKRTSNGHNAKSRCERNKIKHERNYPNNKRRSFAGVAHKNAGSEIGGVSVLRMPPGHRPDHIGRPLRPAAQISPSREAALLGATRSATNAIAHVRGIRCVDHPNDLQLNP